MMAPAHLATCCLMSPQTLCLPADVLDQAGVEGLGLEVHIMLFGQLTGHVHELEAAQVVPLGLETLDDLQETRRRLSNCARAHRVRISGRMR